MNPDPSRWQFSSITYRLLAACVAATAVIYIVSFVLLRGVVGAAVDGWVSQIAQARADAAAARLLLRLDELRLGAQPGSAGGPEPSDQTRLDRECADAPRGASGWTVARHGAAESMGAGQLSPALLLCARNRQDGAPVAVRVEVGWLINELKNELHVRDQASGQDLGWPLIYDVPAGRWLLAPPDAALWLPQLKAAPEGTQLLRSSRNGLLTLAAPLPGELLIGLQVSPDVLGQLTGRYVLTMLSSMVKDMLLILATIAIVSRRTTRDLRSLMAQTEVIVSGQLNKALPHVPGNDEVSRLASAFARMQVALRQHMDRLSQSAAAQQKLESELAIARQIQHSMLPQLISGLAAGTCPVGAVLQPAREVGGDFYDCFPIGPGRLCLVIGDVAGKGIPAALLMARTIALMRGLGPQHDSPAALLAAANRELCIKNDECMFVTLYCGMLDLRSGSCRHASAGHDAPLLMRAGQVRALPLATGPAAGLDEHAVYPEQEEALQPGELLLVYTDGITEATNAQGDWFGTARLLEAVRQSPCPHPAWVVREVLRAVSGFTGTAPQSDDITILALQYPTTPLFPDEPHAVNETLLLNGLPTPPQAMRHCLRALLLSEGCATSLVDDAELVTEELVDNVRAYGGLGPDTRIRLQVQCNSAGITMQFEDNGRAFNPLVGIPPARLDADDDQRSAGGFGFHIVRQLCCELSYDRREDRNCLRLRLEAGHAGQGDDS